MSAHSTAAITQIGQGRRHGHRNHVGESERINRAIPATISTTRADTMMTSMLRIYGVTSGVIRYDRRAIAAQPPHSRAPARRGTAPEYAGSWFQNSTGESHGVANVRTVHVAIARLGNRTTPVLLPPRRQARLRQTPF